VRGTITKIRLKGGRISWGYVCDIGKDRECKRKQVTRQGFATRREADDALRNAIAEHEKGQRIQKDSRLFETFFTDWLAQHGTAHWGRMTAEQNVKRGNYAIRMFGDVPIQKLSAMRLEQDLHMLLMKGGQKTKEYPDGRPLSPKTVREVAALVSQCLDKAVKWKIIERNPMEDVERPKTHEKEAQIPQIDDFEKLLNRVTGTRYFSFVVFAAAAGCRRGEQLALKWPDIDFKTGLVTISKSVSQTSAGLDIKTPKSGKTRFVRISKETIEVLLEHRGRIEHEKELFGEDYQDNNLVFCTPDGAYYQPDQITNRIAEFMQQAGVDASLHSLRHFNASTMLSKKVPIPVVSQRLGHANSQITLKVYSHVMKHDEVTAAVLWDEATAQIVSRVRKPKLPGSCGSADVRFCYVHRPKLA